MTNLPEQCPNCQAGKEWFQEDEDGSSAICPSGFWCMNCDLDVQIEEASPEAKANAKAGCDLFAQSDEDFTKHLEAHKVELQATLSEADEKLAQLRASMTDEQWEAYQIKQTQKHINEYAKLDEFWVR